jgi:MFS family permease
MKHCPDCHIDVLTRTKHCPLCHRLLSGDDNDGVISYPPFDAKANRRRTFLRMLATISLTAIFITALINYFTFVGHLWSVVAIFAILYAWIVVGWLTFKPNVHISLKLMTHAIGITGLLLVIEAFTRLDSMVGHLQWTLSYAMPSIFIAFIVAINIMMLIRRQNLRDYLISQLSLSIIGFVPLILVFFGLVNPIYMSIAAAGLSFATIIGLFLLGRRIVISELGRKFHL